MDTRAVCLCNRLRCDLVNTGDREGEAGKATGSPDVAPRSSEEDHVKCEIFERNPAGSPSPPGRARPEAGYESCVGEKRPSLRSLDSEIKTVCD